MEYIGAIFRPPSEARSLLVQVSIGCSHNKCIFCSMYQEKQFIIRNVEDVIKDLEQVENKDCIEKIFLCDGDALILKTDDLLKILAYIKENFLNCKRVASYATIQDIERKSEKELEMIYQAGLSLLYIGLESGNDEILSFIKKDVDYKRSRDACLKVKKVGYKLSVMIILGLGEKEKSYQHALDSAKLLNDINPEYIGLLSLMVEYNTPLYDLVKNNEFKELQPIDMAYEIRNIIENLNVNDCFFSSVHASNYLYLKGYLNEEKDALLEKVDYYIDNKELLNKTYRQL